MRYEAQGIVSVELRDADGKTLPEYAPGAHIELHLDNGLMCSYPPCDAPEARSHYVVDVLLGRNSRGGSRYVREQLRVGSMLKIGGPRNHFGIDKTVSYTVLVAGGISVMPIACMARRLAEQDGTFSMLYCTRSCVDAVFADRLAGYGDTVRFHLGTEAGGLPGLKALFAGHSTDTHFYYCDPSPILRAFEAACEASSYTNVHIGCFVTDPDVELAQDGGYQVKLTRNGAELCVPVGKSLLDALLETGVEAEHNCREGVCGSCETRVLKEEPDHRDSVLSKSERASNQIIMVCVSGYKGRRLMTGL